MTDQSGTVNKEKVFAKDRPAETITKTMNTSRYSLRYGTSYSVLYGFVFNNDFKISVGCVLNFLINFIK